ncbi:hybrid sensor histidine kinase/response regulator transcription factor [Aestuariivivens insulae]|uniref:hybrid sensor histidine kinase/response regulator transcription factor n=1 Tax=Aestuariivivens insulae TaxID=1621988 RepID=UPI001F5669AE|nr:two-component regulator propeller domain-containing protein [Aestuariivivens insulae]
MKFKNLIVILFFHVVFGSLFGQGEGEEYKALKFRNISLKQGLSQSSVLCILQDKEGFIWFGTRDGLNKYDGNTFKTYRYDSQDSTSLSHSSIKALFEDSSGVLWVGTRHGLNKYIPETDSFERIKTLEITLGDKLNEIWGIVAGNVQDELWLATNAGLIKLNTNKKTFMRYVSNKDGTASLSSNLIRALLKTTNGNLWVKTVNGIDFLNNQDKTFKNYAYPKGSSKEVNVNYTPTLYKDSKGTMWMGFKSGLAFFNEAEDAFQFYKTSKGKIAVTDEVRSIHEDQYGKLWVGTYKGLYILDKNKNEVSHYVHDENDPNSLSQNSIYKIFQDNKGDIWIGTYAGGIDYYNRSYDLFRHISTGTNRTKLNYKVVSSIVETPSNELWIGTEGGGINVYNKKTGTFKYYTANDNPNSISANNVKAMIRDHAGNFWIGTHDGGLNFLNPRVSPFAFIKYRNIPNDSTSVSDDRIISLLEDHENNIWIGTSGGGLNVLNNTSGTISRVADPSKVMGQIVFTIVETLDKKSLLIGSNLGLAKLDLSTKELSPIDFIGTNSASGNRSVTVLSIFEANNQNLWVGTEGDGLYNYNLISGETIAYGKQQGLPNDVVYGIVPDNNNNIWLSTNNGLSRINLQSLEIKNFYESDGLQGNEFNYGAYLKDKSGNLLFGGTNGFNIFNPNDIVENTFVPPVSITSFKVNNKPYLNITDSISEITLKHYQNVFNFDFVALSYLQPNKNQYAYKLVGFDEDWNYVGNKKSATYTNLDDGTYTFKVKASNNDGLWNEQGTSINLRILPAPWDTWWAYLIYYSIAIGIFLVIRRYSLLRIKERNELKHERLEKERIEEVNKMKLQLFTNISHDFRTPLTLIIGPLERLLQEASVNDFVKKQHEIMYRNASVLMELINQLLDFRKSESGKLQLSASKNNIVPFVENIKQAFNGWAEIKDIDFSLTTSSNDIEVWFDKTKLKKVLFNLLSNAFKFTPEHGKIALNLSIHEKDKKGQQKKYVKIKLEDNGKGIPKKNIKFIFDRFYQLGERSGTGIGLALTKNLVKLHGGSIKVKSNEGIGTCFNVLLPLGDAHLQEDQKVKQSTEVEETDNFNIEKAAYVEKELILQDNENIAKADFTDKSMLSILLVEDNVEVRTFIKNIFKDKYNLFEAPDGKSAIEIAQSYHIDLIISDVMMPVMDGIEMCHEIKSNIKTSHIPVILLTARTSNDAQKEGYMIGADAYITKPFDATILEVRVANILQTRKKFIEKFKKDIILQPKEVTVTSTDELFLEKAIGLIEENMSNAEFAISDFITEMGMSRSALYRKLKALTDQSITEFIRTIKLKRAAQLMVASDMSISEIAFDLGFNDLKYFRQSFQKLFNQLPSEYRSNNS